MKYIIDANNLAGQLGLLGKKDFDKKLIKIIKKWPGAEKNQVFLVFDSTLFMGDKYSEGNITIVRAPRDNYYKSADDKIIELVSGFLKTTKDELTVITDDLEIIKEMEKLQRNARRRLKIKKATEFVKRLEAADKKKDLKRGAVPSARDAHANKGSLKNSDVEKINDELLKIWK